MKRIICLIIALCLVFCSFSFSFAQDWSATDSTNLANIRASVMSGGQLYNVVNSCNTVLNNINYNLVTLMGWLDPATGGSTTALLNQILNALVYTNVGGATVSFLNDLRTESLIQSNYLYNLYTLDNFNGASDIGGSFTLFNPLAGGQYSSYTYSGYYNWRYTIGTLLSAIDQAIVSSYAYETQTLAQNFNASQNAVNWANLGTSTFTPLSVADGTFKWLSAIQAPVARLSYVLASDERIEAQEAAAANEQAVVDNFIDSNGAGSASPSDIGSVSDLSSGFSSNISTDADPGDIFDIFDSNNFSWFSQEVADSLDTTNSNNRSKSGSEFETPLLDQRINDIYNALGVKHD